MLIALGSYQNCHNRTVNTQYVDSGRGGGGSVGGGGGREDSGYRN